MLWDITRCVLSTSWACDWGQSPLNKHDYCVDLIGAGGCSLSGNIGRRLTLIWQRYQLVRRFRIMLYYSQSERPPLKQCGGNGWAEIRAQHAWVHARSTAHRPGAITECDKIGTNDGLTIPDDRDRRLDQRPQLRIESNRGMPETARSINNCWPRDWPMRGCEAIKSWPSKFDDSDSHELPQKYFYTSTIFLLHRTILNCAATLAYMLQIHNLEMRISEISPLKALA